MPSTSGEPLVAHCIVGSLRSFLHPALHTSIRQRLLHAASSNYRAFMVVSHNCTHGSAVGTEAERRRSVYELHPSECSGHRLASLPHVLASMPIQSFSNVSDSEVTVPDPRCEKHEAHGKYEAYEKYESFYYQFSKLRTCYRQVEQYEREHDVCFDWIVRSRPDDAWRAPVPHVSSLPVDVITVPQHWPGMMGLRFMVEDHFFMVPRQLARVVFAAVEGWSACPALHTIVQRCPFPRPGWQIQTGVMQSECILGNYLNAHNVTWRHDPRLVYETVVDAAVTFRRRPARASAPGLVKGRRLQSDAPRVIFGCPSRTQCCQPELAAVLLVLADEIKQEPCKTVPQGPRDVQLYRRAALIPGQHCKKLKRYATCAGPSCLASHDVFAQGQTAKTIALLELLLQRYPHAEYYIKIDDDAWVVGIDLLLRRCCPKLGGNYLWGQCNVMHLHPHAPLYNMTSTRGVVIRGRYTPRQALYFAYGGLYALPRAVATAIVPHLRDATETYCENVHMFADTAGGYVHEDRLVSFAAHISNLTLACEFGCYYHFRPRNRKGWKSSSPGFGKPTCFDPSRTCVVHPVNMSEDQEPNPHFPKEDKLPLCNAATRRAAEAGTDHSQQPAPPKGLSRTTHGGTVNATGSEQPPLLPPKEGPVHVNASNVCMLTVVYEPDFVALAARLTLQRRFSVGSAQPTTVVVFDDRDAERAFCEPFRDLCAPANLEPIRRLALSELLGQNGPTPNRTLYQWSRASLRYGSEFAQFQRKASKTSGCWNKRAGAVYQGLKKWYGALHSPPHCHHFFVADADSFPYRSFRWESTPLVAAGNHLTSHWFGSNDCTFRHNDWSDPPCERLIAEHLQLHPPQLRELQFWSQSDVPDQFWFYSRALVADMVEKVELKLGMSFARAYVGWRFSDASFYNFWALQAAARAGLGEEWAHGNRNRNLPTEIERALPQAHNACCSCSGHRKGRPCRRISDVVSPCMLRTAGPAQIASFLTDRLGVFGVWFQEHPLPASVIDAGGPSWCVNNCFNQRMLALLRNTSVAPDLDRMLAASPVVRRAFEERSSWKTVPAPPSNAELRQLATRESIGTGSIGGQTSS